MYKRQAATCFGGTDRSNHTGKIQTPAQDVIELLDIYIKSVYFHFEDGGRRRKFRGSSQNDELPSEWAHHCLPCWLTYTWIRQSI